MEERSIKCTHCGRVFTISHNATYDDFWWDWEPGAPHVGIHCPHGICTALQVVAVEPLAPRRMVLDSGAHAGTALPDIPHTYLTYLMERESPTSFLAALCKKLL